MSLHTRNVLSTNRSATEGSRDTRRSQPLNIVQVTFCTRKLCLYKCTLYYSGVNFVIACGARCFFYDKRTTFLVKNLIADFFYFFFVSIQWKYVTSRNLLKWILLLFQVNLITKKWNDLLFRINIMIKFLQKHKTQVNVE